MKKDNEYTGVAIVDLTIQEVEYIYHMLQLFEKVCANSTSERTMLDNVIKKVQNNVMYQSKYYDEGDNEGEDDE